MPTVLAATATAILRWLVSRRYLCCLRIVPRSTPSRIKRSVEGSISSPAEEKFWDFIKTCFRQPRRMLRNNLMGSSYAIAKIPEATLQLRAQQMSMQDLLQVWNMIRPEGPR